MLVGERVTLNFQVLWASELPNLSVSPSVEFGELWSSPWAKKKKKQKQKQNKFLPTHAVNGYEIHFAHGFDSRWCLRSQPSTVGSL